MKRAVFVFSILSAFVSSSFAADPAFNANDPIGRTLVYSDGSEDHYLGCFCIERDATGKRECKRSQFAIGTATEVTHNFLGNVSSSWTPIGASFDEQTGKAFYEKMSKGETADSFARIWSGLFETTSQSWNGNSEPVKVKRRAALEFIDWVQNKINVSQPVHTEQVPYNSLQGMDRSVGSWTLTGGMGELTISKSRDGYEVTYWFQHHFWTQFEGYHGTVSEKDQTLAIKDGTFIFRNKDGNLNKLSILDENGLVAVRCNVFVITNTNAALPWPSGEREYLALRKTE